MGNFTNPADPYAAWQASVPKIETADPVLGGAENAALNKSSEALVKRSAHLEQQLSDAFGIDLTNSAARAHAQKAAELFRLFGNRMFEGSQIASPANNTVRLNADNVILVGGYWFDPSAALDKSDLANSASGGLYLNRTGFDGATHLATWAIATGALDGADEFSWGANGVRSVANRDKFFLANYSTNGSGVVTLTNKASPLSDDAIKPAVGTPFLYVKKGASDTLPANWTLLDGSTVDEPRSPFDTKVLPNLNDKFPRGTTTPALVDALASGGADTHTHTGTSNDANSYVNDAGGGGGYQLAAKNHTHILNVDSQSSVPAYVAFAMAMRLY